MPSQRERESESRKERGRTGRRVREGGREGRQKGVEAPGRCLGSFSRGEWDPGQGDTKVGEFLIRIGRDRGRRWERGEGDYGKHSLQ